MQKSNVIFFYHLLTVFIFKIYYFMEFLKSQIPWTYFHQAQSKHRSVDWIQVYSSDRLCPLLIKGNH